MIAPAVMFIEIAADALPDVPPAIAAAQRRELRALGSARLEVLGVTALDSNFIRGYELGLQTMRLVLAGQGYKL